MNEYILENFRYNEATGEITRQDRRNSLGSYDKQGYLILKIKGKQFKAHRIAWFLYHGSFPLSVIDHVNRIKSDNRICNLRDVSVLTNSNNIFRKPNCETGYEGVYVDKTKRLTKKFAFNFNKKTYRYHSAEEAFVEKQKLINKLN